MTHNVPACVVHILKKKSLIDMGLSVVTLASMVKVQKGFLDKWFRKGFQFRL